LVVERAKRSDLSKLILQYCKIRGWQTTENLPEESNSLYSYLCLVIDDPSETIVFQKSCFSLIPAEALTDDQTNEPALYISKKDLQPLKINKVCVSSDITPRSDSTNQSTETLELTLKQRDRMNKLFNTINLELVSFFKSVNSKERKENFSIFFEVSFTGKNGTKRIQNKYHKD
jgi:hypothetical protein